MSELLEMIQNLVHANQVRVSAHGYDELEEDQIDPRRAIAGVEEAVIVEDYPEYPKGPCVLVRQTDDRGGYIHVLWGIPEGKSSPAVLVTAYRPDSRWSDDALRRLP